MDRRVTFQGNPMTLVGRAVQVGRPAPDFRVLRPDLKELNLAGLKGTVKLITTFLSLDTPVCDLQVKEFNQRAVGLSGDVVVLGLSKDLPFAQQRFCEAFDIKSLVVASDYRYSSFGVNYGVLVKELNLLARGVLIIDRSDVLRYMNFVTELTTPPDYEAALTNLGEVLAHPETVLKEAAPRCTPVRPGTPPWSGERITAALAQLRGWRLIEGAQIAKEFQFRDFAEAKYFLDVVSVIAEDQGHHPDCSLGYGTLRIVLTTHAVSGLTGNDFILAGLIDELGAG